MPGSPGTPPPTSGSRIALGRTIFYDPGLSDPQGTSCASCHAPERAFSGNHGSSIGVAQGSRPNHFASRSTPSLLYLRYVPRFHFHQDDDAIQPSAVGGFFWDGRADSISELVRQPLLNPDEMNNRDSAQVALKVAGSRYAADFRREFGEVTGDAEATVVALGDALEAFLTSDDMAPFSSKYDAYVRGDAKLTSLEAKLLELLTALVRLVRLDVEHPRRGQRSSPTLGTMRSRRHAIGTSRQTLILITSISGSADVEIRAHPRRTTRGV